MAVYDFFVAALRCPCCGAVSPEDASTDMRTELRGYDAYHEMLRVGDDLEVGPGEVAAWGDYHLIRKPAEGEPIHLVHVWQCPTCNELSFAEVVIRGGILESITVVPMSLRLLDRAHGVSYGISDIYPTITDTLMPIESDEDPREWLVRLRNALPADGSDWVPPGLR